MISMTNRERLIKVMEGEIPDCVPVCPDISNMVPARLTGKPFWDIYLYQDPPLWKAYIDAVRYFDIDGGFELYEFGDLFSDREKKWEQKIIHRDKDRIVTRDLCPETGEWSRFVLVHTRWNPPSTDILPGTPGLPEVPDAWEEVKGAREWPTGMELWKLIRKEMGENGIVGMPSGVRTVILERPEDVYAYYENPRPFLEKRDRMIEKMERRMKVIEKLDEKPDFLFCGASGSLVFQSPEIFRELILPALQKVTELADKLGIPTHVHSCGPEKDLVKMVAEETRLTVVDPLEVPPMGDCNLAELKNKYGNSIILKGNLHTTEIMLKGYTRRKSFCHGGDGQNLREILVPGHFKRLCGNIIFGDHVGYFPFRQFPVHQVLQVFFHYLPEMCFMPYPVAFGDNDLPS